MSNAFANPALPSLPGSHAPLPPLQHQPAGVRPNVPANVALAAGHRRIQSQNPNPVMGQFGFNGLANNPYGGLGVGLPGIGGVANFDPTALGLASLGGMDLQGLQNLQRQQQAQFQQRNGGAAGHGRRHSMNVTNKVNQVSAANDVGGIGVSPSYGGGLEGFDDGFAPPAPGGGMGGHSRASSQAWRNSAYHYVPERSSNVEPMLTVLVGARQWRWRARSCFRPCSSYSSAQQSSTIPCRFW